MLLRMSSAKERDRKEWLSAVGRAVRTYRTDKGLSQEALGYKAQLHRTYVSDLERGQRNLTAVTLLTLARTLDTRPSEILRLAESLHAQ